MRRLGFALASAIAAGCGNSGQERTQVPLFLAGTELSEPILASGGVPVTLTQAQLAFGPLYLCAGATAGDLCDTARLEWLDSAIVDTTAAAPVLAGELTGVTGSVRSWMYDLGISSQLTRGEPFVLEAAAELGDASFAVAGSAQVEGIAIPFRASIPVQQTEATELGVPVIRKSESDAFSHQVTTEERGLLMRFDPAAWLRGVDFHPYVSNAACSPTSGTVCAGSVEQTCDVDGSTLSTRDCSELGQVCVPSKGCADELVIDAQSEAFRSLRNALVAGRRPTFEWGYSP